MCFIVAERGKALIAAYGCPYQWGTLLVRLPSKTSNHLRASTNLAQVTLIAILNGAYYCCCKVMDQLSGY